MRTACTTRIASRDERARGDELTCARSDGDQPVAVGAFPVATVCSEIMSMLVHDIKQPLAAVGAEAAACSNRLSTAPTELAPIFASLNAIVGDVRRAGELLDRMQTLLTPTPALDQIELDALLSEVVDHAQDRFVDERIALIATHAAPGCRVQADAKQLGQVILSLLLCAAKACRASSSGRRAVRVGTHLERDARHDLVHLTIEQDANHVHDDRVGLLDLNPSNLEGASIALCRSIVERHGGRVHVINKPEGGASLCVVLPSTAP